MNIKILTPESVIFEGEVDSILLPGSNGEFHMMKNHAAIVSSLKNGKISIFTESIDETYQKNFQKEDAKDSIYTFEVKSGVIEFANNKGIILAE